MKRAQTISWGEKLIGHLIAPALMCTVYSMLSGQYLLQFYTDVVGIAGGILVWMPLLCKIISAMSGFFFGWLMDRTRTRFGKARPWLLVSGLMLGVLGACLYAIPQ